MFLHRLASVVTGLPNVQASAPRTLTFTGPQHR